MTEQEKINNGNMRVVVIVLGSIIAALLIFAAGMSVGIRKARFSGKFMENYERNFMRPDGPMDMPMGGPGDGPKMFIRKFEGRDFRNAHGTVGKIVSIAENKIIINDPEEQENTIAIDEKTVIKRGRDSIGIADLKNDDKIAVMGKPNDDGTIKADLIRVLFIDNKE